MIDEKNSRPIKRPYSKKRVIIDQDKIYKIDDAPILREKKYYYNFNSLYTSDMSVFTAEENISDFKDTNIEIKSLSTKAKVFITLIVSIAVALIIGSIVFSSIFSSEAIAKKYIKAYGQKDYKTRYSLLYLTNSPFLTLDNYETVRAKEEVDNEILEISNIKLKDKRNSGTDNEILLFEYDTPDYSDDIVIHMKKTEKKLFGLFTEWKVYSENEVAYGSIITAPLSYNLSINGTNLTDDFLESKENDYYNSYSTKHYKIDIFSGENTVKATAEYMEDGMFKYDFKSGLNINVEILNISEDLKNILCNQFKDFTPIVYGEIIKKNNTDNIKSYVSSNYIENVDEEYNYTLRDMHNDWRYQITSVELYDFNAEFINYKIENETLYVNLKLEFKYTLNSNYTNYIGKISPESNTSYSTIYATYICENGQWKIASLDLKTLYT